MQTSLRGDLVTCNMFGGSSAPCSAPVAVPGQTFPTGFRRVSFFGKEARALAQQEISDSPSGLSV
jgi:hypothetical protein